MGQKCRLCIFGGTRSQLRGWARAPLREPKARAAPDLVLVPPVAPASPGLLGVCVEISLCLPACMCACKAERTPALHTGLSDGSGTMGSACVTLKHLGSQEGLVPTQLYTQ